MCGEMMKEYIGKSTKTQYLEVVNKLNLFHIIYLSIADIFTAIFISLLIALGIKSSINFIKYMSYILIAILLFIFILLIVFIVAKIAIILKNKRLIKYYMSNKLINVRRAMINYDYKLWLTAVKDSFHPMSLRINENDKAVVYKTGIYFTNSETYNKLFKFKMPKELIARSYIDVYALIGYDDVNNEMIIIEIEKQ